MWYKVIMIADDQCEAIVFLSDSEYEAVQSFLDQVKKQWCTLGWVGGHWFISPPCTTKEEAVDIDFRYED